MKSKSLKILSPVFLVAAMMLPPSSARSEVPGSLTHQGRLFDNFGDPITGTLDLTFTIYDAPGAGAAELWSEVISVDFDEGYYSAELGLGEPIDVPLVFDGSTRFLGVAVEGDAEMTPRATVGSVPYALVAQDANGDIHPTSVEIEGVGPVIDSAGAWVGPPTGVIASVTASGGGQNVSETLDFLAPTATVTVGTGERVVMTSFKTLGSTAAGGGIGLALYACRRLAGGSIIAGGGGMLGLRVPQNTSMPYGLTHVFNNLPAGTYDVGLCGSALAANAATWNDNEFGYTTAMVTGN
ncbi:MAG: hypothetical protein AAF721_38690 [Myxococcota bacterium]